LIRLLSSVETVWFSGAYVLPHCGSVRRQITLPSVIAEQVRCERAARHLCITHARASLRNASPSLHFPQQRHCCHQLDPKPGTRAQRTGTHNGHHTRSATKAWNSQALARARQPPTGSSFYTQATHFRHHPVNEFCEAHDQGQDHVQRCKCDGTLTCAHPPPMQ